MAKAPKTSVIIPTFNRSHLVGMAIQSVLNQTSQDFELIIVDDASTDKTDEVIQEFQQKDNRIIYIKHRQNKGGSAARNTGIRISKGKYIAFLDSDDVWLPEKLAKQVRFIENKDCGFIYCNFIINDKTKNKKKKLSISLEGDIFIELLKRGNGICTSALMVKKHLVEKVGGFDENLPSFQDYDLLLKLSQQGKCGFLNEVLFVYNLDKDGISKEYKGKMIGKELVLSKYCEYYDKLTLKKNYSKHYYKLATQALLSGNREKLLQYCKISFKYNPFFVKSCIIFYMVNILGMGITLKIKNFLKILK